jgi:hypothetical protein
MRDIFEVLRRKQAQQAQLAKEIEMLQQAAEKLREVAPLLGDGDDDGNSVLGEVDESSEASMAAKASAQGGAKPGKSAPRWP